MSPDGRQIPGDGGGTLFLSGTVHPLVGLLVGFITPVAVAAHGLEAYPQGSFGLDFSKEMLGSGVSI